VSEPVESAPVSGSCVRCGCPLGYAAAREGDAWLCCGACAGSDRCQCGCKPEFTRELTGDVFVPTRRMFAARHPDGLNVRAEDVDHQRAFPFSDKPRGK
jgi:hypothetical protein